MGNKRKTRPKGALALDVRAALAEMEARLLTKILAERNTREREGAADEERFEQLEIRIGHLASEQTRWIGRVRWLEKHVPAPPTKSKRRKRTT